MYVHAAVAHQARKTHSGWSVMGCFKKKPPPVVLSYDDENCPYGIKPSELFKINEVGGPFPAAGPWVPDASPAPAVDRRTRI